MTNLHLFSRFIFFIFKYTILHAHYCIILYYPIGFCIFPTWAIVKITLIPFNIIIKSFSYFQLFLIPMSLFFTGSFSFFTLCNNIGSYFIHWYYVLPLNPPFVTIPFHTSYIGVVFSPSATILVHTSYIGIIFYARSHF